MPNPSPNEPRDANYMTSGITVRFSLAAYRAARATQDGLAYPLATSHLPRRAKSQPSRRIDRAVIVGGRKRFRTDGAAP